jgi:hypothetical protein
MTILESKLLSFVKRMANSDPEESYGDWEVRIWSLEQEAEELVKDELIVISAKEDLERCAIMCSTLGLLSDWMKFMHLSSDRRNFDKCDELLLELIPATEKMLDSND